MDAITEITLANGEVVDLSEVEGVEYVVDDEVLASKCPSCGEWFDHDEWQNESTFGDLSEDALCYGCYEADGNYVSTLHRFIPGEPKSEHQYVLFGDHTAYGCTEDSTSEAPDWFLALLPKPWTGRPYVHSSAWRGYYNTSGVLDGLTEVEDGWMTGDYSDVPWKRDSHAFLEALAEGEIEPPCEVYVLFEPTSNVFSTATTILAPADKAEALSEWLGQSEYDLHRALG